MEYIKQCMENLNSLDPVPTGLDISAEHRPKPYQGIKAVLFDIYGTLLVSSSGDIFNESVSPSDILSALSNSGLEINSISPSMAAELILSEYKLALKKEHERICEEGIEFPEVDIIKIWDSIVSKLLSEGKIEKKNNFSVRKLAFIFEMITNPVYPMPFMNEVLETLDKRGKLLGVISNAQFYTPLIMNYFITGEVSASENIHGFSPALSCFSYREREAKPSLALFSKIRKKLEFIRIFPKETLFVGNDMLKDIYPAAKSGFRTVLFAGDKRSLRLRKGNPLLKDISPDYIVDDLKSILQIAI